MPYSSYFFILACSLYSMCNSKDNRYLIFEFIKGIILVRSINDLFKLKKNIMEKFDRINRGVLIKEVRLITEEQNMELFLLMSYENKIFAFLIYLYVFYVFFNLKNLNNFLGKTKEIPKKICINLIKLKKLFYYFLRGSHNR